MFAEKTARKQRGRPFPKGASGNPSGRPKGTLNRTTQACQELLDGEGEAITHKAVVLAKRGNIQALRLCLDRILPARKDRLVSLRLPEVGSAKEIPVAIGAVLDAVAEGQRRLRRSPGPDESLQRDRRGRLGTVHGSPSG